MSNNARTFKVLSWNVNGIRAVLNKGFAEFAGAAGADVLCLQETKATADQVDLGWLEGYHVFWNAAEKKGYSGVAALTRREPLSVRLGMGHAAHDSEGRVLTLEFEGFWLVNVYTPNSQRELVRLDYRQAWDAAFLAFLKELEKSKPVVFCGDLNVAHEEIDLRNPKTNRKNAGFTDEERAGLSRLLEAGFVDTFRELHPGEPDHYSWWSYRAGARSRNVGWRIDYIGISDALRPRLRGASIHPEVMGSDHCPVALELEVEA
ncbi:exodeoxyribonuclease III [soil metagenome]